MALNLKKNSPLVSDINVTPLVDVMLVLLVIFMITAPLILNGIKLQLPKTKEVNKVNLNTTQLVLSYTKRDEFFIGKEKVVKKQLIFVLKEQLKALKTDVLYLRADKELSYGKVAGLLSQIRGSGITNIALVTESEKHEE